MTLHDPFNRSRLPAEHAADADELADRQWRVRMLAEAFEALVEGRQPSAEASLFLGGAGLAWLQRGGDLTRDYLRVKPRRGSKRTASAIWRDLDDSSSR